MILGAAIGGALPAVSAWDEGYRFYEIGGVMAAMLQPAGGFGKFLLVLLALSIVPGAAGTMYGLSLNWQALFNLARLRLPQIAYPLAATAVIIPVSIRIAVDFLPSLSNFVSVAGTWSSCFIAVLLLEHLVIRRGRMSGYDLGDWDDVRRLPTGLAALGASLCSMGLVIPSMSKTWFVGPIAEYTGSIEFEVAIVVTGLLYVPFRLVEMKMRGRPSSPERHSTS